jgi:polyhydroxybutyrate depolymerase
MMKANKTFINVKIWVYVFTLLSMGILSGCGGGGSSSTVAKTVPVATTNCAGQPLDNDSQCIVVGSRESIIYQPAGQQHDGVAVFLHGSPGNAKKVMAIFDAKSLANTHKLIVLGPAGKTRTWGWQSVNDLTEETNTDVDYINELLIKVRGDYNVTSDKVYIFGYSAGGFMAYKLACQMPELITAVISLAGQYRGDLDACPTATGVNLHHFHSPTDQEVPMAGRASAKIVSVDDTITLWRQKNGCDVTVDISQHPGVTSDSSGTSTESYQNCDKTVALSKLALVAHESRYLADKLLEIYAYLLAE